MSEFPTLEEGLAERERLRADRQRNYAVKEAAGWTCQHGGLRPHEGCTKNIGVVVVDVGKGSLQCRCVKHIGKHKPLPGQWIDRSAL